jgi:hypothetical protein
LRAAQPASAATELDVDDGVHAVHTSASAGRPTPTASRRSCKARPSSEARRAGPPPP